jgi:hypothetical protein
MFPRARSAMNWTFRLLAVALAAASLLSVDLHGQSTAAAELERLMHMARISLAKEEAKLCLLKYQLEDYKKYYLDDSKKYYHVASALDPKDPEPYYSIGVIDWMECHDLAARAADFKSADKWIWKSTASTREKSHRRGSTQARLSQ